MARSCQWRRTCSDLVFWHQTQAQNATIYILRETGPTGFLLKEEGETKPCKAFLGDPHSCTCSQFLKDRDLCKHICWLLLKKFRVPQTNNMSWQQGLVEREINELLRGLNQQRQKRAPTAVTRWRRPISKESDDRDVLQQRDINDDDVCPICQDELLAKRLPVTYCKFGCGNSIHIKCMKVWAEHQKSQGEMVVKCPFCREDFGPFELLKYENRNAEGNPAGGRMDRHIGVTCQSCHSHPIEGKCYRCSSCADFHLCQSCFNTPLHTQHAFQYRHKRNQRWRPAQRAYGAVLPQAVVDDLVNREISDNDYDLLTQLDTTPQAPGSSIPEEVVLGFPLEKVRDNGPLLAPGLQCRVCLRAYLPGQFVRKLPRCKHKFHRDCIDNWLLHSRPTCPIDGLTVWDPISSQMEAGDPHNRKQRKKANTNVQSSSGVSLEVPGVGLTLQSQCSNQPPHPPQMARGRPPIYRPRDRADREAGRVLAGMRASFALNGIAVGSGATDNDDSGHMALAPDGRLHATMNQHYNNDDYDDGVQGQYVNGDISGNASSHVINGDADGHTNGHRVEGEVEHRRDFNIIHVPVGQESDDPLDLVIAANRHVTGARHVTNGIPQNNASSLFSQDLNTQPDITANLLSNAERLSPYRQIPNVFTEAVEAQMSAQGQGESWSHDQDRSHDNGGSHDQQMVLESARTYQSNTSTENRNGLAGQMSQPHYENTNPGASSHSKLFANIPTDQRLFADNPTSLQTAPGQSSSSQITFNPDHSMPPREVTGSIMRGGNSGSNKRRLHQGISSAPASIDGVGYSPSFHLTHPERGRGAARGRGVASQLGSTTGSQGRYERTMDQYGPILPEGQRLLDRLTMFSDLYLGNSPTSHAPVSGTMTATGLPPRPTRRPFNSNHDAVRMRRLQTQRRNDDFSVEGKDVTLRDLFG